MYRHKDLSYCIKSKCLHGLHAGSKLFFFAFFKNGGPSKTLKSPAYPRICHDLGKAGDLSDCSDCSWNTEECFPLIVSPGMKKHAHVMFQH